MPVREATRRADPGASRDDAGLTDLGPLLTAPALKQVLVIDMDHLQPEQVAVLARHPTLEAASVGLGSARKNTAVEKLLTLPETEAPHEGLPSARLPARTLGGLPDGCPRRPAAGDPLPGRKLEPPE